MKSWLVFACLLWSVTTFASETTAQSLRPVYEKGIGTLVVDLSIGAETGENEDVLFYSPTDIRVDSDGGIIIADPRMPSITKFDRGGRLVWRIDSKGQGPGDIETPTHLAVRPDGSIVVYDIGNRRFALFAADGKFLNTIAASDWVWDLDVGNNGDVWVQTQLPDFDGRRGGTLIKILRYSPDLKESVVVDSTRIKDNTYVTEPLFANIPVPFAPIMAWAITPAGNLVIARSGDYAVKILSPTLDVLAQFQHPGKRVSVTEEDKSAHFAQMESNLDGVVKKGAPEFVRENTEFPRFKPYFNRMRVDEDGYILFQTHETATGGVVYDVFEPDGSFLNRVVLPDLGWSCVFRHGFVYQLEQSEDAPARIKRCRIK